MFDVSLRDRLRAVTSDSHSALDAAVAELPRADGSVGDPLVDLFAATGLVASKGAARRAVAEGGLSVNNERVSDEGAQLAASQLLGGRYAVLRRGRRSLAVVQVVAPADHR